MIRLQILYTQTNELETQKYCRILDELTSSFLVLNQCPSLNELIISIRGLSNLKILSRDDTLTLVNEFAFLGLCATGAIPLQ